jgi:cyclopropane-fatty-acyl-phospholipid synthase
MTQLDQHQQSPTEVRPSQSTRRLLRPQPAGSVAAFIASVVGADPPVAFECFDGSRLGPTDAPATVLVNSADALRRIVTAPTDLGFGRAWVMGDIDVRGDLYAALALRHAITRPTLSPAQIAGAMKLLGRGALKPPPIPAEEAKLSGRVHGRKRDSAAISHHYDVSNAFYRLFLGPSMTYSCAVWEDGTATLEDAQAAKHELICRKLDLKPGMRLLDVGCGWGSMLIHAATHHGVRAVGITISAHQAELARQRVAAAGLTGQIEIRLQDYRDVIDGPYDAISSIGMFEHVGLAHLGTYFGCLFRLLPPGGRLLNHGVSFPPIKHRLIKHRSFVQAYVFPDGEAHEVGTVVSAMQNAGFESRHMESLREHYALTLRQWVSNLEANWDAAVAEVGERRARVWRLYMTGCVVGFEDGGNQVHQNLAVRPTSTGCSGMPRRPGWDTIALVR